MGHLTENDGAGTEDIRVVSPKPFEFLSDKFSVECTIADSQKQSSKD